MKLEVGKAYLDRGGIKHTVMGVIEDIQPGKEWVWTLEGLWFVQETGQRVVCTGARGFQALPTDDLRTLVEDLGLCDARSGA